MTVSVPTSKQQRVVPALLPGEVHVWKVRLDLNDPPKDILAQGLDEEERARVSQFRFDVDRERFSVAHAVMRRILSHYLQCSPIDVSFRRNEYGKPQLVHPPTKLQFNLSHTDDLALIAVTLSIPVGVDVERHNPRKFDLSVARMFFSRWEYEILIRTPLNEQMTTFFRYWARREAFSKGFGLGFSFPSDQFEICENKRQQGELLSVRGKDLRVRGWTVRDLDVGPGYSAAVAAKAPIWQLHSIDWQTDGLTMLLFTIPRI